MLGKHTNGNIFLYIYSCPILLEDFFILSVGDYYLYTFLFISLTSLSTSSTLLALSLISYSYTYPFNFFYFIFYSIILSLFYYLVFMSFHSSLLSSYIRFDELSKIFSLLLHFLHLNILNIEVNFSGEDSPTVPNIHITIPMNSNKLRNY